MIWIYFIQKFRNGVINVGLDSFLLFFFCLLVFVQIILCSQIGNDFNAGIGTGAFVGTQIYKCESVFDCEILINF